MSCKFSIIIPTYKHLEDLLKPCIESIRKYTDLVDMEIIVVANGPDDGTKEWIRSLGEPFVYIGVDEQIGYTKACNVGIKASKGEYVILLNNDIELLPQGKNNWLKMLEEPFVHGFPNNIITGHTMAGITGPMVADSIIGRKYVIFFCAMIPRRVLDDVGLLDEAFAPGFCEDNDWCARAEDKGYGIHQVPNSVFTMNGNVMLGSFPIYHKGNKTFGNPEYTEGFAKNIELLKSMYLPRTRAEQMGGYMPKVELDQLVAHAKKSKKILEIGSWHGKSTTALAEATEGVVYAVDTWYGSDNEPQHHGSAYLLQGDHAIKQFLLNTHDLVSSGKIIPIRMHSANACALFKETGMKFDMIFIDGDHTYEGCKSDILNTVDLLEPDGILCGHDYITWPGVKQAVDELVGKVSLSNSIWTKQTGVPCIAGKKRVFDCFLFHDEIELLEIRLNELDPVVDKFIIIESAITHSGNPKPFYFEQNKERFAKFLPKIQYVKLDSLPGDEKVILNGLPNGATWVKERYQRDTIKQYVDGNDNDVVIVTDMDEIPNVEAVRNYKPEMGLRYFDMKLYCYWLNCYSGLWDQAKIIGYKDFKNMTPCFIRYTNCPKLDNGGWHFSFQGGVDRVLKKIVSWAHSEYNLPHIANKEWITEAINAPKDVLRRKDVTLEFVKIDSTFPKYIVDNIDRYKADGWIKEF